MISADTAAQSCNARRVLPMPVGPVRIKARGAGDDESVSGMSDFNTKLRKKKRSRPRRLRFVFFQSTGAVLAHDFPLPAADLLDDVARCLVVVRELHRVARAALRLAAQFG